MAQMTVSHNRAKIDFDFVALGYEPNLRVGRTHIPPEGLNVSTKTSAGYVLPVNNRTGTSVRRYIIFCCLEENIVGSCLVGCLADANSHTALKFTTRGCFLS